MFSKRQFLAFLFIYCFLSLGVLLGATGGWAMFSLLIYSPIIFGVYFGVPAFATLLINRTLFIFPKKLFYFLLIFQFLAFLFIGGDCGDGEGYYFFLDRVVAIFSHDVLCNSGRQYFLEFLHHSYIGILVILFYFLYIATYVIFVLFTLKSGQKKFTS